MVGIIMELSKYVKQTTDTGLVHRVVGLFTLQPLGRYQNILLGDSGT